jgi:phosphonate transport system substrate-binding protein
MPEFVSVSGYDNENHHDRRKTVERNIKVTVGKTWAACALAALALTSLNCDRSYPEEEAPSPTGTSPAPAARAAVTPEEGITLVWGTIADNPQEEKDKDEEHGEFLVYMTKHLRKYGVKEIKLVYCHNPKEMGEWIRDGKVDIFDESPFGAYLTHHFGGADEPIANRWKNGNEKFGSVIFSKKDGPIKTLDDLKGKMMVFRGDTSTANYFRQKVFLIRQGYKLVEKKNWDDPVAPDEIGYYFSWTSRDSEVEAVMDGRAAAGGTSDEFVDQLLGRHVGPAGSARHPREGVPQTNKEDLRILARIPPVLRRVVTLRKSLDPTLKAAITDFLLEVHETPEGAAVMATFGPSTRFSAVNTDQVAYQGILDQGELLEEELKRFAARH